MESILVFTGIQYGIHNCINRNTVYIHRKTDLQYGIQFEFLRKGSNTVIEVESLFHEYLTESGIQHCRPDIT